jgi:hypothetical protein
MTPRTFNWGIRIRDKVWVAEGMIGTGLFVVGAVVLMVSAVIYWRAIRVAKGGEGNEGQC